MKLLTLVLTLATASGSIAQASSITCVSENADSVAGTFTINRIDEVYRYGDPGVDGVGADDMSGGYQTEPAVLNADGTTTFNATNECDNDLRYTFKTAELTSLINGQLQTIKGTHTFDDDVHEPVVRVSENITCNLNP